MMKNILNRIIDFDSCNFEQGDIEPMIKFLREMDSVLDGVKTGEEALEFIAKEDIRPRGTEKLNEIERCARSCRAGVLEL